MKQRIRLTEGQLHEIIKESVNRILNEEKKNTINESRYNNDNRFIHPYAYPGGACGVSQRWSAVPGLTKEAYDRRWDLVLEGFK